MRHYRQQPIDALGRGSRYNGNGSLSDTQRVIIAPMRNEPTYYELLSASERFYSRFGVPRWLFTLVAAMFLAWLAMLAVVAVAPFAGGVLILIGALTLLRATGNWILRPFTQITSTKTGLAQFTIADFFSLVFVIQLALGLIHALSVMRSRETPVPAIVIACLLCCLAWFINVRRLSHAGINQPTQRVQFLAGVLPLVYLGIPFMIAGPASIMMRPAYLPSPGRAASSLVILATFFLPVAFYWAAAFVRRMLADSLASRDGSE